MDVHLRRLLAVNPSISPYRIFDIPDEVLGEQITLPHEYLEARYADAIETIRKAATLFVEHVDPDTQGSIVASQVVEWLRVPGNWFYVARECRQWHRVPLPNELLFPNLWIIHVGMICDVLFALDGTVKTPKLMAAGRYIESLPNGVRSPYRLD